MVTPGEGGICPAVSPSSNRYAAATVLRRASGRPDLTGEGKRPCLRLEPGVELFRLCVYVQVHVAGWAAPVRHGGEDLVGIVAIPKDGAGLVAMCSAVSPRSGTKAST